MAKRVMSFLLVIAAVVTLMVVGRTVRANEETTFLEGNFFCQRKIIDIQGTLGVPSVYEGVWTVIGDLDAPDGGRSVLSAYDGNQGGTAYLGASHKDVVTSIRSEEPLPIVGSHQFIIMIYGGSYTSGYPVLSGDDILTGFFLECSWENFLPYLSRN